MKKYMAVAAVGVALVAGCKDSATVNPTDSPTAGQLTGALTRPGLQTLVLGIIERDRSNYSGNGATYPVITEILARDAYRIDASEPRYVSETLGGNPDPGSFAGGGGWTNFYTGIRAANTTLAALANVSTSVLSPQEKSVTLGVVRTLKALEYYQVLELRDTVGIALQADDPNVTTPAPIICKEKALDYIAALLDSANADLVASNGATTPFTLPAGFTSHGRDYRKASNFILFNRGLKGKVDVYRGLDHAKPSPAAFTAAIAELTQALGGAAPGAVSSATFKNGVYHDFVPSGNEAAPNALADSKLGLNPAVHDSILPGDTRSSKIVTRSTLSGQGLSTTYTYVGAVSTNAANLSAPFPILTDEELVLLRAQAEIESNDLASATADLNSVHTAYGLTAYPTFATQAAARNALLYEKRYSLLFTGPQRLVDLRAYGRLNAANLPKETTADPFNSAFPIPKAEADARNNNLAPSCS